MGRLRKFLYLDWQERRLLLRTALLVMSVRAALSFLPFDQVNKFLARRSKRRRTRWNTSKAHVLWAVRNTAAFIPGATCLAQALAAKYHLEHCGLKTQLHLGVAKDNGRLLAHAWLQCDGETVLGGEIAPRYAPLLALN
jgi:hypothetical protein